ncbi:MAG: hypothetical protein ACTTKH_00235 [Treponema sp.]
MKRVFKISTYLLLACISFSLLTCGQSQFTGTVIKKDIDGVFVKFNDGNFESIYTPGAHDFSMPPVSSKQVVATIKVVVGEKGLNVKIRGSKATPSKNNALEFFHKLNLKSGSNFIPIIVYRDDEKTGETFEVKINRKVSEGALRLTHLKCKYTNYSGDAIETDDFIDEIPYNGVYKRRFATSSFVNLEVGSPELNKQVIEVNGASEPYISTTSEYSTYRIPLKETDTTSVDIIVYDSVKGLSQTFRMNFNALTQSQKESTSIDLVKITTEDGDFFEFDKLDMTALEPYRKGRLGSRPVVIENIYRLNTILVTHLNGLRPTISIKTKEPGAKVELVAKWNEIDHDQTSRPGLNVGVANGWSTDIENKLEAFAGAKFGVLTGHDTDMEFKFCPYNQGKIDLLFKITSPDTSKVRYYEVKYGFIFVYAYLFDMEPFQAIIQKTSTSTEIKPVVIKSSDEEGLYNVYIPHDAKSIRFIAYDRVNNNVATGYKKKVSDLWDYRFYLSVDDGDFSRTHPSNTQRNYKEIPLKSTSGQEEHKLSVVTYQSGELKDGGFVDEYGRESGVQKIQKDFRFRFIKEDRQVAPALSVLKIEGTPKTTHPVNSAINGKVWPTMGFRPAISDNTVALVEEGITYKLKMLKTDADSEIRINGQLVSLTEDFSQKLQSVSEKFPNIITADTDNTVSFYTYELKETDYYENGKLKEVTIPISVIKGELYREYQLHIIPVNPNENYTKISVIDSNGGSARVGSTILYKEHEANKPLTVDSNGKLFKADFQELGITGVDGILSCRGKLKAGHYYDIYALGDDKDTADSMLEHYYVSGMPGEVIGLIQTSLTQNGGADYTDKNGQTHRLKAIRGSFPVRLMKQVKTESPKAYNDGAYFFFRQKTTGIGGSWQLKPCNLTCGDAHIKMEDSNAGALTDMVVWFDVSSGNSIEPVAWGPDGVSIAFDSTPFAYASGISMTDYNPNGKISMEEHAVEQQGQMKWEFPSGVYDLILVAYDVAGNRLERHQLVSIEAAKMMEGKRPGFDTDKDERKIKFENFRVSLFRWPTKLNLFENKQYFENLFGMPWTEYTPPEGQGDIIKTPSTYLVLARGYIGDDFGPISISGVDLYRRCVDDNTPFRRVSSTIPPFRATPFSVMDTDFTMEEGKTYQYKMIASIDEGSALETEYIAEVKVPPAFMYFLDNIKVEGQGGGVQDGTVYKYNANKLDKAPVLKATKYPRKTPNKDKKKIKIDYSARISNPKLWDKEYAAEIDFGITVFTRDAEPVFASKCLLVFEEDGEETLHVYLPRVGRYATLKELINMKAIPRHYTIDDLLTFDKKEGLLTIKDNYLRIVAFNWAQLLGGDGTFNYEAGNTYYWDIVSWGRVPIGGNVASMAMIKGFDAKKKDAPAEKYRNNDGQTPIGGIYIINGNADNDGNNSINGRCRFTVVQED